MKSYHYMLIALILGGGLGASLNLFFPDPATHEILVSFAQSYIWPVGQLFLRLIFMIVVPLVMSALILGIYELGASEGLKKILGKTIFYTIVLSSISVVIGVGMVNWIRPGELIDLSQTKALVSSLSSEVSKVQTNASQSKGGLMMLVELIPKNPLDSALRALDGEMISLMLFSLFFGAAMIIVKRKRGSEQLVLERFFLEIMETCTEVVNWAMKLAPLAVFALLFTSSLKLGPDIFKALFAYVAVVLCSLAIHLFGIYSLFLNFWGFVRAKEFFINTKEVLITAFSTSSSNATLPQAIVCAEHKLKLPKQVSRFVLTVGATANQNGTALFEGITVLFLAQVYHVELSVIQQIQVVLMSILAGIGTAGVPGGSLPLIMIILQNLGIPIEGIGLVLGVDRLLDMSRTVVNVGGDLVIASLVSEKTHH